jgi:DNA-binding MarR family transcriptional regulator
MIDAITQSQAKTIVSLLPTLMRQLFAGADDPAAELPLAQLRVCGVLYGGARSMSAVGRELGVSLSAMTQIADRLERACLVERIATGTDRRIRCLQLTERGEKMMRRREKARVGRVSLVLQHLTPKTRKDVLAALQTLIQASGDTREQEILIQASGDAREQNGHPKKRDRQLLAAKVIP